MSQRNYNQNKGRYSGGGRPQHQVEVPKVPSVDETWTAIKKDDYTKYAEEAIKTILKTSSVIKTNQVRNIYALISPFFEKFNYNEQINEEDAKRTLRKIKIKIAYQIGRDEKNDLGVRVFNNYTNVLGLVDVLLKSNSFLEDLRLYCDYFEAVVAYHKFYVKG